MRVRGGEFISQISHEKLFISARASVFLEIEGWLQAWGPGFKSPKTHAKNCWHAR